MRTAVRVADICGGGKNHSVPMLWKHVDLEGHLWTIPDTKMGKPHVVPLSDPAILLLAGMAGAFVIRRPTMSFRARSAAQ